MKLLKLSVLNLKKKNKKRKKGKKKKMRFFYLFYRAVSNADSNFKRKVRRRCGKFTAFSFFLHFLSLMFFFSAITKRLKFVKELYFALL